MQGQTTLRCWQLNLQVVAQVQIQVAMEVPLVLRQAADLDQPRAQRLYT